MTAYDIDAIYAEMRDIMQGLSGHPEVRFQQAKTQVLTRIGQIINENKTELKNEVK
jgi:hypothetical protein